MSEWRSLGGPHMEWLIAHVLGLFFILLMTEGVPFFWAGLIPTDSGGAG